MTECKKTGDWKKIDRALAGLGARFRKEIEVATGQVGSLFEAEMVGRFEEQGPGWARLSPEYLARKIKQGYSEQILIRTATLMNNIRFHRKSWKEGFVGILRNVRSSDGQSLVNIAAVHEYGSSNGRIPARPFVAPTLEKKREEAKKLYERAVRRVFRGFKR